VIVRGISTEWVPFFLTITGRAPLAAAPVPPVPPPLPPPWSALLRSPLSVIVRGISTELVPFFLTITVGPTRTITGTAESPVAAAGSRCGTMGP
jgi:hypothetical protein